MDALAPGVHHGREVLGLDAQNFRHAARAVHEAAREIPFEDDAVDGVGCEPEHFLALREPKLRLLALGDVPREDRNPADKRIVESRRRSSIPSSGSFRLDADAMLAGEAVDRARDQLAVLGAQRSGVLGIEEIENVARVGGCVMRRVLRAAAHVEQPAVGGGDADRVLRMFDQRAQVALTGGLRSPRDAALADLGAEDDQPGDALGTPQRLDVDLEAARRTRRRPELEGIVVIVAPVQAALVDLPGQRARGRHAECRAADERAGHAARSHGAAIGIGDVEGAVKNHEIERQLVGRIGEVRARARRRPESA